QRRSYRSGSDDDAELPQAARGRVERCIELAETEADVGASQGLIPEEARARHRRNTNVANEVASKLDVVHCAEGPDSRHDVIRALGPLAREADLIEHGAESIAPGLVIAGEPGVILPWQRVGDGAGGLQGSRRADRYKVVDLPERVRKRGRRDDRPDPPAR